MDFIMTSPPRPRYNAQISFGNVITIVLGMITAAGMYFVTEARSQVNLEDIKEIKSNLAAFEERMRGVENEQARSDERFSSILTLLSKIDTRLERIEARN